MWYITIHTKGLLFYMIGFSNVYFRIIPNAENLYLSVCFFRALVCCTLWIANI